MTLLLAGLFTYLRAALRFAHIPRVLERAEQAGGASRRARMEALLGRADVLMTSAAILKISCDLLFLSMLLALLDSGDGQASWTRTLVALALAVPLLLLGAEALPTAMARRFGDGFLVVALPPFYWLQLPLRAVVVALEASRRAILRVARVPDENPNARQIVAGLRQMIDSSGRRSDLDETERELIGNLMEFQDVDVAAVMTPRTEVDGIAVSAGIEAVVRLAAEKGHSRIPVYEGSLDEILGYVSARGLVQLLANGELEGASLREQLQPVKFVPETKRVSELLTDFRRERQKLAIVVDEYGGTAGLVTLGDVLEEIVGEIQDEFDEDTPAAVNRLEPGVAIVDAAMHVSDVNEELGLSLPEEQDFETLGGFVLAQLGRFPKQGEGFEHGGVGYEVVEASDRRVLKVRVRTPEHQLSS